VVTVVLTVNRRATVLRSANHQQRARNATMQTMRVRQCPVAGGRPASSYGVDRATAQIVVPPPRSAGGRTSACQTVSGTRSVTRQADKPAVVRAHTVVIRGTANAVIMRCSFSPVSFRNAEASKRVARSK
jgi:hypothetical protein